MLASLRMELHQLRYLVAVVDEGSFTAAAVREHVSQSGVSAQVAKLERELGQPLLVRQRRSVALTEAGRAVLPLARAALAAADAMREAADDVSGLRRGRVALGMVRGCSIPPFLDALAAFRHRYPGVEVTLAEGDSADLVQDVLDATLDVALIGYAGRPAPGLEVIELIAEPVAVAVPPGHRLAALEAVALADLAGEALLCLPAGTGIRAAFDRSCRRIDVDLPIDLEASSPDAVLGLARRGAGVAVLSASMAEGHPLVVRPIVDADTLARLGLCRRVDATSSAARELMAAIAAAMGVPLAA